MQLQKVIEHLGYTSKEAKVYLATLELGEAHISDIAMKVKMPRSSVQVLIDKLREDGLVNFYVQRRYKYWVAENPERILANFHKREEEMRSALPELTALRRGRKSKRGETAEHSLGNFRVFADSTEQPVIITSGKTEILYVNEAWEALFGYELEEVRGLTPRVLRSGKTPQEAYTRMWQQLEAGDIYRGDDIIDRKKDGTEVKVFSVIMPLERGGRRFYIQILEPISK